MTTLFTSNFYFHPDQYGTPVRIALLSPKSMPEAKDWPTVWPIMPRWAYFKAPRDEWDAAYLSQLERHGVDEIAKRFRQIEVQCGGKPLVLCCHEHDPARCHRGTFARWWIERTGEIVQHLVPQRSATTTGEVIIETT